MGSKPHTVIILFFNCIKFNCYILNMNTTKSNCKAKNPATCPYHGNPNTSNSLKDRLKSLTAGKPVYFSSYNKKTEDLKADIVIKPNGSNVKAEPVYINIEGKSHEDINNVLKTTLRGLKLKEYKTGYSADVTLPASDNEGSVPVKFYASTMKDPFADESVTEDGVEGMKQTIIATLTNEGKHNKNFNKIIESIKDSKVAHSVNGAKAIAVVEAMNEFKYFHLDRREEGYEVTSAFESIMNETHEYTNRGWGIRVHMDYRNNGELYKARFSLDEPNSKFNSFSKADVDRVNVKLNEYFASFEK